MELGPTALIRISTSVSARRLGLSLFHNRRLARNFVLPTLTNSADFLDRTNHRNLRLVRISHPFLRPHRALFRSNQLPLSIARFSFSAGDEELTCSIAQAKWVP